MKWTCRRGMLCRALLTLFVAMLMASCASERTAVDRWRPEGATLDPVAEEFIDDLIDRMTVVEKLGQLTQYSWGAATGPIAEQERALPEVYRGLLREGKVGSFLNVIGAEETRELQQIAVEETRLGIPLIFGYDVIHGFRTEFPVPLAEAATWNPDAVREAARVAAIEAASNGLHWTFAPMVDIARDARWGRIVEGSGEDTYLGMVMAAARVRGFQGDDLTDPHTIVACAKHFAAYGGAEGGRDYNTVDLSERSLREVHLPPFHAAVHAGVGTFMTSFNEIAGIPATVSPFLFDQVLREEWGFDGFVVSDWNAIGEALTHGVGGTRTEVGRLALRAGVDMDMMSDIYPELEPLAMSGEVPEDELNEAVRRVLRIKHRLGLFDDPYRYSDVARQEEYTLRDEHRATARDVARQSIVLLQNEGDVLPLQKELETLAVIGPLGADDDAPLGPWAAQGRAEDVVNVLEGISEAVGSGTRVLHERGVDVDSDDVSGIPDALAAARQADAVVLVLGESRAMSGEAASRSTIDLPGVQLTLAKEVAALGKPTVVVLMSGRPLATPWIAENMPAIVEAWFLGVEMGNALADVLFGDYNPSGRLTVSVPRTTGQIPIYYNHKMTGRPPSEQQYTSRYLDLPPSPLYSFGHGLSYTTFAYSDLEIPDVELMASDTLWVGLRVRNAGERAGKETVQLYLRDPVATVTRPVKELRGFAQVHLEPGEEKSVTFGVPVASMGYLDVAMERVVEPGLLEVMVGHSAADIRLQDDVRVAGETVVVPDIPRFTVARVE